MRELQSPAVHVIGATLLCHDCACAYRCTPGLISLSAIRAQTQPGDWWTDFGLLIFAPKTHRLTQIEKALGCERRSTARAIARMLRLPTPPRNVSPIDFDADDDEPPTPANVRLNDQPPPL